jgi:hypothetical protein
MKYIATLVAVIALAVISAGSADAKSASYTCVYQMNGFGVYLTISGSDNRPTFCGIFFRSAGGSAYYHRVGSESINAIYACAFQSNSLDVNIRVSATKSWQGKAACALLGHVKGWTRY